MVNLTSKAHRALEKLLNIDGAEVEELANLLTEHLEQLNEPSDARLLSTKFKKLDAGKAFDLLDFLAPFCIAQLSESKDYRKLIEGTLISLSVSTVVSLTKLQRATLKSRLTKIFSNPVLALKSKAIRLKTTQDKTYQRADVLTDMRPVFSVNGNATVEAAVTFQTLRIEFYENGATKSFSCAMDSKDIRDLKDLLDRAEKKEKALFGMLKQSGISTLKVE